MNKPTSQLSIWRIFANAFFKVRHGGTRKQTSQLRIVAQHGTQPVAGNAVRAIAQSAELNTFERIEEYKTVLDQHAQLSARRQHTNDVFVGLNTIFLTALGFLLLQSHLDTWWIFVVVSAITLIITPLNAIWRIALHRYGYSLAFRYDYLREIEQEFRTRRGSVGNEPEIGLFSRIKETGLHRKGNTQLEMQLATYFICLYPVISLVVGILVYLVRAHLIPPLNIV
jgi:hypothetical protein